MPITENRDRNVRIPRTARGPSTSPSLNHPASRLSVEDVRTAIGLLSASNPSRTYLPSDVAAVNSPSRRIFGLQADYIYVKVPAVFWARNKGSISIIKLDVSDYSDEDRTTILDLASRSNTVYIGSTLSSIATSYPSPADLCHADILGNTLILVTFDYTYRQIVEHTSRTLARDGFAYVAFLERYTPLIGSPSDPLEPLASGDQVGTLNPLAIDHGTDSIPGLGDYVTGTTSTPATNYNTSVVTHTR